MHPACEADGFSGAQQFALQFVVDDRGYDHVAPAEDTIGKPSGRFNDFGRTIMRMSDETKRAGVEKNDTAHGYRRDSPSAVRLSFIARLNSRKSSSAARI